MYLFFKYFSIYYSSLSSKGKIFVRLFMLNYYIRFFVQIFSEYSSLRIILYFFFFFFQVSIPANYSLCRFHSIKFRFRAISIWSHAAKDQPVANLNFLRYSYVFHNYIMSIACHAKDRAVLLFEVIHRNMLTVLVKSCIELIFLFFKRHSVHQNGIEAMIKTFIYMITGSSIFDTFTNYSHH